MLVDIGARDIHRHYQDGKLVSFKFLIEVNGNTACFKLPAKVNVVRKVLLERYKRTPNKESLAKVERQAERTAWKIVHDWVEIQVSMIHLEQAEVAEVFLPYYYDPQKDKTLWNQISDGSIKLLN